MNELELVNKAMNGDAEAFGELVRIYQNAVYAIALRFTGNFSDAHDLTQETFIQAYIKLYQLASPDKFASWLKAIAVNTGKMWIRNHKSDFESINIPNPVDLFNEDNLYGQLISMLSILPEDQRMIIVLRYIDELSYQQIGEFLGLPIGTVRSRIHRAKSKLKRGIFMIKEILDKIRLDTNFSEGVRKTISELEESVQDFERKLDDDPNNSAIHFEIGCGYAALYEIVVTHSLESKKILAEKAIGHLQKSAELGGGTAGVYIKMAEVYGFIGEYENVKKMIDKAGCYSSLEEESEWIQSIITSPLTRASLSINKGMYAEIIDRITNALEIMDLKHNKAEAYAWISACQAGKGEYAQSITSLGKFSGLDSPKSN